MRYKNAALGFLHAIALFSSLHGTQSNDGSRSLVFSKTWKIRALPQGKFSASKHLELEEMAIDLDGIDLKEDEVLVKTQAFSVDAFVRTTLAKNSYHPNARVGETLRACGVGTVIRTGSNRAPFAVGTQICCPFLPVSSYAVLNSSGMASPMKSCLQQLRDENDDVAARLQLGLFGLSGFAAYVGIFHATPQAPRRGETVVVSAAAGGVGTIAAQLAKLQGARVIGIAGGSRKKKFLLKELGLDGAIDYKDRTTSVHDQLVELCPDGIDFYFDNVGGPILDLVLERLNRGGRISLCGAVSQYDTKQGVSGMTNGPANYLKLAEKSATMAGFSLLHSSKKTRQAFDKFMLQAYKRGTIKSYEHIEEGIESFGLAMEMLSSGQNLGRLIVQVDD